MDTWVIIKKKTTKKKNPGKRVFRHCEKKNVLIDQTINREKNSRLFNKACFKRRQQKNSEQIFNVEQDTLHAFIIFHSFFFFFFFLKHNEAG